MLSERRFDVLITSIYEAAADFRRWPDTLRLIAQAFDAPTVVLGRTSEDVRYSWLIAPDIDPAVHERYVSHFHHVNPLWPQVMSAPIGTAQTDRMILPKREFVRTEFFNDFLRPQGLGSMLGTAVHAERGEHFHIVVQKGADFGPGDIHLYERLAPHLQRAVQFNVKLAWLDMQCAASADALERLAQGTFLVDVAGQVLFANRTAARMTEANGYLRLVAGILRAKSASDTAKLHALIASCGARGVAAGGGSLSLTRGPERTAINLCILPWRPNTPTFSLVWRPMAIIFAVDPDLRPAPPAAMIRQRYGLTRAEAAFALEILRGDGIQACADRLGITRATARTHLSHIFHKTCTQRQAELVRLLMEVHGP